jgi:magnesium chelatase family protein
VTDFLNQPERHLPVRVDGLKELSKAVFQGLNLKDVKGQSYARRALEIAAAGGHNLILSTAKSLKASARAGFTL